MCPYILLLRENANMRSSLLQCWATTQRNRRTPSKKPCAGVMLKLSTLLRQHTSRHPMLSSPRMTIPSMATFSMMMRRKPWSRKKGMAKSSPMTLSWSPFGPRARRKNPSSSQRALICKRSPSLSGRALNHGGQVTNFSIQRVRRPPLELFSPLSLTCDKQSLPSVGPEMVLCGIQIPFSKMIPPNPRRFPLHRICCAMNPATAL